MAQTVKEPTDVEIRKAIAETIREALVELYSGQGTLGQEVKVHDHWLWGFALGENAAVLRVTVGAEKGKIHAWMIGLQGISRQRPQPQSDVPNRQGAYRLRNMGPNRRDLLRSYRVWCYHQLDTGDTDNNSENRLALEIEAIADAFSKNPQLGIDNEWMMGAEEIQFSPIDVFKFGEAQANVAQGTLNVRLQKPLDLNQY
jgi:hypothetical protein